MISALGWGLSRGRGDVGKGGGMENKKGDKFHWGKKCELALNIKLH